MAWNIRGDCFVLSLSLLGTHWFRSKSSIGIQLLKMSKTNLISLLDEREGDIWLEKETEKKEKQKGREKP